MEAKEKMNGVTGRRIYCWNADVKLNKRDFASTHATAWFLPDGCSERIGEEYELKIDKAPQNVDSP